MSIMLHLSSLALKGAAQAAGDVLGIGAAGAVADGVVGFLNQRFVDHSQRLNKALARASDRAWRAVEVALAGNSWWDRCKRTLSTAQERAFREQVQAFLKANPLDGVDGFGQDFRVQCHAQLQAARKAGLLKPAPPPPDQLARHVGSLARFGDPAARVQAEHRTVVTIAAQFRLHGYDALATFLELRPASGPPVLAAAVHYFFQREVEHDRELFQGLAYAQLESLARGQSAGFASLAEALDEHGERLEALLADVQSVVVQTRADVLDVKRELQRQGQQMQELGDAVLRALQQHHLEKRTLHTGDSLSIRDEDERRLVKDLVRRYRSLPAEQRQQMPALLNAVGKLEVVTGEFESAQRDFRQLAQMVPDSPARAEAAHNAYLAALERRAWDDALAELNEAARLDPARFAPFPTEKFEPERILGAGGFGVAFLCRNTRSGGRVVIKTLRSEGLDRGIGEVFREAQTLEELEHPAIIRIRDCDFADSGRSRPYLVMDYFQGQTLAEHVEQNGPLKVSEALPLARLVAEGLQRAHERGILHRDVKPANLLVRPVVKGWETRLIDFGLAMRAPAKGSTARSSLDRTLAGSSIAGTLEYAAPEQMGKLKGVAVGTYSDVYGFGKTCCFALFGTAQPTFRHWQTIPRELADLLGRCIDEQPGARPRDFAAVLRELDRLMSHGASPLPEAVVLDAQPVREPSRPAAPVARPAVIEDVVPVREPRRASSRPDRPRHRDDDLDDVAKPVRSGGMGLWVVLLVVVLPLAGLALLGVLLFSARTPRPTNSPWDRPVVSMNGMGVPGFGADIPGEPIKPEDFKKEVLDKLQTKPPIEQLRDLARRLAATPPTEKQKEQHAKIKQMRELKAPRNVQEEAERNDDILQVSRALNPLLRDNATTNKKAAALAMQRWGTEENVPELIANVGIPEWGVVDLRIEIARALAAIGDERGIAAVASRLGDLYDRPRVIPVLISFGTKAEPEMIKCLGNKDQNIVLAACKVLKEIGTEKSLAPLEKVAVPQGLLEGDARAAIDAIKARQEK
jgi:serine/threonine protein kinase